MDKADRTHISLAIRHYSSLFTFPTLKVLVSTLFLVSVGGSSAVFAAVFGVGKGLYAGITFGLLVLALPTLIADILIGAFVTKGDPVFTLRRCIGLSIFICSSWVIVAVSGGLLQSILNLPRALDYASVFAVAPITSLRFLAFSTVSPLNRWKTALATLIHPVLYLFLMTTYWNIWSPSLLLNTFLSTVTLLIATLIFIHFVDNHGKKIAGVGSVSLLRDFVSNWVAGLTTPLEEKFEKMGSYTDISVALLSFQSQGSTRALMVVPTFHPGPFKNLGSSDLPHAIQISLEERFGATVAVPHGASGHELDLTSRAQCEKVLRETLNLAQFNDYFKEATRMVRVEHDGAKATCQLFGECALVTITCAPKSMDDVPREAGLSIVETGKRLGAREVIVVDAHNSIGRAKEVPTLSDEELEALKSAAEEAIKSALNEPHLPFRVGASKVLPQEFSLTQGMGPCGIATIAVVTGGQTVSYVIVDGNNMVRGLREKILESIKGLGIDDGEVMTTDTHSVNAVVLTERGYYPVGEAISQDKLIAYIKRSVSEALGTVQESTVSWRTGVVRNVKAIGGGIVNLSMLVNSSFKAARRLATVIFLPATIIAILLFLVTLLP